MVLRVWQAAYNRWYDHDHAGHGARAVAWGLTADALCRLGDVIGWGEQKVDAR